MFLCSPGNPTAKAIPLADIQAIVESSAAQQNCIVVVDEAYVDFSTRHPSAVSLVTSFPNVVVLQTLSKAFGLAAIRCGFCIGPPDIIQLMNNVKAPYNVNALTSQMAMRAMDETDGVHKSVQVVLEQREIVAGALRGMVSIVQKVYDSDANFLLVRLHANAQAVYKKLADDYGIVTRYRGTELHCDECIRVTIGTPPQNQAFLDALPLAYAAVRPENNQ